MIRPATLDDLPALVQLGAELCAESPRWSRVGYNSDKARAAMHSLIENDDGFLWVGERDGKVVGAMLGLIEAHWAGDERVAQEVSLFVHRDARGSTIAARLICELVNWAEARGARWLQVGTSTGVEPERTVRLYERLSFRTCAIGLEYEYGH
jgi:GNAT superfamily N-acetyltransferase